MIYRYIFSVLFVGTAIGLSGQSVLLNESFDSGIPPTWEIIDQDGNTPVESVFDTAWVTLEDFGSSGDSVAASTSYYTPAGTAEDYLITPALPLGGFGNILTWEAKSIDASYPESYVVLLSSTDQNTSSFTDTILDVDQETSYWQSYKINLEDLGYVNQTVYLAFVNNTNDGYGMMLNNIKLTANDASDIKGVENSYLKVYPNPVKTSEWLYLSNLGKDVFNKVELHHMNGQHVASLKVTKDNTVRVPEITPGAYFITIETAQKIINKKIIIY